MASTKQVLCLQTPMRCMKHWAEMVMQFSSATTGVRQVSTVQQRANLIAGSELLAWQCLQAAQWEWHSPRTSNRQNAVGTCSISNIRCLTWWCPQMILHLLTCCGVIGHLVMTAELILRIAKHVCAILHICQLLLVITAQLLAPVRTARNTI